MVACEPRSGPVSLSFSHTHTHTLSLSSSLTLSLRVSLARARTLTLYRPPFALQGKKEILGRGMNWWVAGGGEARTNRTGGSSCAVLDSGHPRGAMQGNIERSGMRKKRRITGRRAMRIAINSAYGENRLLGGERLVKVGKKPFGVGGDVEEEMEERFVVCNRVGYWLDRNKPKKKHSPPSYISDRQKGTGLWC